MAQIKLKENTIYTVCGYSFKTLEITKRKTISVILNLTNDSHRVRVSMKTDQLYKWGWVATVSNEIELQRRAIEKQAPYYCSSKIRFLEEYNHFLNALNFMQQHGQTINFINHNLEK